MSDAVIASVCCYRILLFLHGGACSVVGILAPFRQGHWRPTTGATVAVQAMLRSEKLATAAFVLRRLGGRGEVGEEEGFNEGKQCGAQPPLKFEGGVSRGSWVERLGEREEDGREGLGRERLRRTKGTRREPSTPAVWTPR